MISRFFLATILGGRLHPNGIPEWGPWEASRLHWWPEDHPFRYLSWTPRLRGLASTILKCPSTFRTFAGRTSLRPYFLARCVSEK